MPRKEPRNYKKEYEEYHGKPKQIKNRNIRNAARKKMVKAGRVHKGDGKEVDHIKGPQGGNKSSNLRIVSRATNRRKGDRY
jgi:ABC-type uncharacterized transport system fused permease/ATPase subunit